MLIMPHSRACAYVGNAVKDSPQELRDRADIRAFAPGAYIDSRFCKSVRHYENRWDVVPNIDSKG